MFLKRTTLINLTSTLRTLLGALLLVAFIVPVGAQSLITMSNKCLKRLQAATASIEAGNYDAALPELDGVLDKCSAKDAQEQANAAKARAYNGLKRYGDALDAANAALAVKDNSVDALFQRGVAYAGLGQNAESKADFDQIVAITQRNENVGARASIFAQLADLSWKQGMKNEAYEYMNQAIFYDDDNANYYIQSGDMKIKDGKVDEAFMDYDKAVALGKTDLEMYEIRSTSMINAMQKKYGTTNSSEMAKQMTADEKARVCADLTKAFELGLKDIQLDLLKSMVCR